MTSFTDRRFSLIGFAAATAFTLGIQGSLLVGFDQLATSGDRAGPDASQWVKSETANKTIALERVVITARRA